MINVKELSKSFGRNRVLRSVDLMVGSGECVAIFGPNGAGKSTLLQILAGAMKPTAGKIQIGGIDTAEDPISTRRSIGFVSHLPLLYSELTAHENLTFYGHMYDVPDLSDRIKEILSGPVFTPRLHKFEVSAGRNREISRRIAVICCTSIGVGKPHVA